jgi:lipopolysaccharide/colanic/teichoic acid biosynthesis glycosyltransferase
MITKRLFDLFFVLPGLVVLSPLFLLIGCWIKLDSPGPMIFRQQRVGLHGVLFDVLKFRTMVNDAELKGAKITVGGDSRITRSGRFLRKFKLDELPQLINVIKGEMSLVGPRPEVPEYVRHYPAGVRDVVLSVPPGITDYASLEFRNENDLLAHAPDPQQAYIEKILPIKLGYYQRYVQERTLWKDFCIILRTLGAIIRSD